MVWLFKRKIDVCENKVRIKRYTQKYVETADWYK